MSLPKPLEIVEKLQTSLQTKAKAEPAFRFYAFWDKVYRKDVLLEAYRRCHANAGAAGADNETFERIEAHGLNGWLGTLREERSRGITLRSLSWAERARRAHANAIENLAVFAPLLLIAASAGVSTPATVFAAKLYLAARLVHFIVYAAGIPVVRTLCFLVGVGATLTIAAVLLGQPA